MANELQNAFEKLSNQARFVQMIVNKELSVSGRKKAAIVVDLRKHEFRPFPKVKSKGPKSADDAEDGQNPQEEVEVEEEGSDTDFDYLLSMPIWNLTREKVCWLHLRIEEGWLTYCGCRSINCWRRRGTRRRSCLRCWSSRRSSCGIRTWTGSLSFGRFVFPSASSLLRVLMIIMVVGDTSRVVQGDGERWSEGWEGEGEEEAGDAQDSQVHWWGQGCGG